MHYGYPKHAMCTFIYIYLPHGRLSHKHNLIFHWSVWSTAGDVVQNPLSAKDKLTEQLLTQFLPKLIIEITFATPKKEKVH